MSRKLKTYHGPSIKARQVTRGKLSKNPKLYLLVKSLYSKYCKSTHFLHTLPDYLIIGTARSASTSLYQYLIQHSSVIPALTKQLHFFDTYYSRGIEWYKVCLPYKWTKFYREKILKTKFVTGEATPHYMIHPLASKRVFEIIPNVKLIVILRNPVDRAYSHYQTEFQNKNETLSFEDAISDEPHRSEIEFEKLKNDENYISKDYPHRAYLTSGIYIDQLKRWMEYFPREQFLILKSEDFATQTSSIFNETLKFLGLPEFELTEYEKIHSRNYEKMNPDTRKKLIEYFKPYNEQLHALLGRDFGWDK